MYKRQGRFFNAEIGEGAPIKQVWDGQGLDYEYFVQVKGGPNDANGMAKKALAMMTSSEMLAGSAKYIAYAPWRKSSISIMEKGEPWYKDGRLTWYHKCQLHRLTLKITS